jgi:cobalamin biosynthesis protein CobT
MSLQKTPFNLKPLLAKLNALLEEELSALLNGLIENYEMYKETHMAVLELPVLKKINQFFLSEKNTIQKLKCENGKLKEEILSLQRTKENISLNILDKDVSGEVKEESTMYAKIIKEVQTGFDNDESSEEEADDSQASEEEEDSEEEEEEEAQASASEEDEEEEEEEKEEAGAGEAQASASEAQASASAGASASEEEEGAGDGDVETEEEEEDSDSDGEEVFKIEIDDIDYYTNDEVNGFIYEITSNEDVGKKVGYFKDEEPFFY